MMHAISSVAALHFVVLCLVVVAIEAATSSASAQPPPRRNDDDISSCLISNGVNNFSLPGSPSYAPLLNSTIRNRRFELPGVGKPAAVVLPSSRRELQRAVLCARACALAIRVRSGGHSYEGLSYTTENGVAFVVIDLARLNHVRVDARSGTAWAESGATLGEVYAAVGRASRSLAFPAGSCSTVGMGGHAAGGGFGLLSRKFGLAADNVLDAVLVDATGAALTRATMDADVFWALRGGGGGSWGVVYAWKLRLVPVPRNVTVFTLRRTGPAELVAGLIHRWQHVAPGLPDEFYLSVYLPTGPASTSNGNNNLSVSFIGQVLAPKHVALSVLTERLPELGLAASELSETSWLESTAKLANLNSVAELTDRQPGVGQFSKAKSDYVTAPMSLRDTVEVVRYLSNGWREGSVILDPYGGAMARVASAATPFPHRAGYLYSIQYGVSWTPSSASETETGRADDDDREEERAAVGWLRSLYAYMAPYVSKHPRAAYVNYVDLDLGTNGWTNATGGGGGDDSVVRRAAQTWGQRYFLGNFDRLVRAKSKVDPGNVFNHAQSIPPALHLETVLKH